MPWNAKIGQPTLTVKIVKSKQEFLSPLQLLSRFVFSLDFVPCWFSFGFMDDIAGVAISWSSTFVWITCATFRGLLVGVHRHWPWRRPWPDCWAVIIGCGVVPALSVSLTLCPDRSHFLCWATSSTLRIFLSMVLKTVVVNIWNLKKNEWIHIKFFQMWSTSLFTGFGSVTIRPFSWLTLNYSK